MTVSKLLIILGLLLAPIGIVISVPDCLKAICCPSGSGSGESDSESLSLGGLCCYQYLSSCDCFCEGEHPCYLDVSISGIEEDQCDDCSDLNGDFRLICRPGTSSLCHHMEALSAVEEEYDLCCSWHYATEGACADVDPPFGGCDACSPAFFLIGCLYCDDESDPGEIHYLFRLAWVGPRTVVTTGEGLCGWLLGWEWEWTVNDPPGCNDASALDLELPDPAITLVATDPGGCSPCLFDAEGTVSVTPIKCTSL